MYTHKQRMKAVLLYIQYDFSAASVIRELGYPKDTKSLCSWYKEYKATGALHEAYAQRTKYDKEQRRTAVQYYMEHGKCLSRTVRKLGYPSRTLLRQWILENHPEEFRHCNKGKPLVHLNKQQKGQAVIDLCTREGTAQEVANKYKVSRISLYAWSNNLLPDGRPKQMPKKNDSQVDISETMKKLRAQNEQLLKENEELQKKNYRLRLEKDVLEAAAEVLKKDQGISLETLTNREKAIVIDTLRQQYHLKELLVILSMAKSSYCYQEAAMRADDKYAEIREKIRQEFAASGGTYGYRRIHSCITDKDTHISEKVVRRLMTEEKLVVKQTIRHKYNSYKGELSPAVENLLKRNFHADKPNEKWLTDITEFRIPTGKVYLSPIIDCFDGLPVSWTIGTSPNAELANTMLRNAIATLKDEHPIVHSDRGCHYRWPEWIKIMESAQLTRSMSKKGCSPDNSACEGFFGRMKNEMFYNRSWESVTLDEFIRIIDRYMHWYAEDRIKISLGGMSPMQYRRSLGLMG